MNNTRKSKDQLVKDLQAAQDEIEIGKALDRVRAQALGMQESHELDEVSFTLSAELSQLLPEMVSSSIGTVDRDKRVIHDAQQLPDWSSGEVMPVIRYGIDEIDSSSPMWHAKDIYEAREQGKAIYRMDKWRDGHVASLFKWFDQYFTTNHPDVNFKFPKAPGASASVWVFSETGWIAAHRSSREPFDDQEITVIKRFADIFDFAYSRFLELKEKEEQVRVADQRAAVDRVRAEAAGMEGTEDIANVVKTLWEGLQGQNVDYDFLSMEVIDEDANLLQAYAAIPDDSSILSLLAMDAQQSTRRERVVDKLLKGVNLLRSEISLSDAIEAGFSKADLSRTVLTDDSGDDRSTFRQKVWGLSPSADRRPSVKAVRAGFDHGSINLYMGIDVEIADETVALVEALGEAVSLGFARYWDFRELEEQNRALEQANEEVREATRLKSQFLATMSHELRTPMNAIIGFTRLVLRRSDNLEDRQRGNLEKVQLSANHLLTLINDVLDLSKVEAGRVDVAPSTFNVPPLLEHCCATVGPTLGKPGVELICDIAEDVGEAYTDEDRLRQIMINLLSNALKFTDKGEVKVDCWLEEGEAEAGQMLGISVRDTGIGIPEDKLGTIFEEFRQVDGSSTRRHQGTGLGLAITKRLIELMGGNIGVESEEGKGSMFTVQIPVKYRDQDIILN